MAHFSQSTLERPENFNFTKDVIDYWATKTPDAQAMYWTIASNCYSASKLGIQSGERIVMIIPRTPAWWEIALAAIRSGIVICPATTLLVEKDIEFRCNQTGATAFFGDSASVQKFLRIKSNCSSVQHVIQVDETCEVGSGVVDFHGKLKSVLDSARFERPALSSADEALIYFTSGTSGPPKLVRHNHISYPLARTLTGKHWLQLRPGKIYWNLSEQGWAKAAWSFFGAWNCGATLFIHDDRGGFNPLRLLHILHTYPITTLCAPPTAYRQLVLQKSTGEPLNAGVIDEWQKMTGLEIYDGYGQTETVLTCGNFAGTPIRPGSMGKPSPGVPLKIIDQTGNECKVDTEGDLAILVSGAASDGKFFGLFDGYISSDGKLDKRISKLGENSWYLTGDRATRDKEGYYWFVGRADDVINSAGYRIGPFEVESTLKLHPGVAESAVVSSPDLDRGEVVKAFIVLTSEYREGKDNDAMVKELQDFCKKNAAPYKYPRKIQIVDEGFLPKTISGKIKRNELKASEWKKVDKSKL